MYRSRARKNKRQWKLQEVNKLPAVLSLDTLMEQDTRVCAT
jgi:hypothetical protein